MLILCNVYRDSKKNMLRISGKNIAMIQSTYRIMIHLMWFCVLSQKVV